MKQNNATGDKSIIECSKIIEYENKIKALLVIF